MNYNSYQVAEIIGVNVSTIKRWTDSGKMGCNQTIGGHRKFHINHIRDFVKKNDKTSVSLNIGSLIGNNKTLINAININDTDVIKKYCYRNLIIGKYEKFLSLNNSLIIKGVPIYKIFDSIIIPILKKIGLDWSKGKISIAEEHMVSEKIRSFLSSLNFNYSNKKKIYNAFCFTLKGDKHDLPLYMGESILNQNKNFKIFNLGSNLPVSDFIKISKKIKPEIIFVSLIFIENIKKVRNEFNSLCKTFDQTDTKIFFRGKLSIKSSNVS